MFTLPLATSLWGGREEKGGKEEIIRQLTSKITRLEKENTELRRKSSGYNSGARFNSSKFNNNSGKSYESMSGEEKVKMTCADFNTARGCNKVEMNGFCGQRGARLTHSSNKLIDMNKICWRKHSAENH